MQSQRISHDDPEERDIIPRFACMPVEGLWWDHHVGIAGSLLLLVLDLWLTIYHCAVFCPHPLCISFFDVFFGCLLFLCCCFIHCNACFAFSLCTHLFPLSHVNTNMFIESLVAESGPILIICTCTVQL